MAAAEKQEKIVPRLRVKVNTPKGVLFDGEADFLVAPGKEGILGIGPEHTKIVSLLKEGELIITSAKDQKTVSVKDGLLQVNKETIDILVTV